MRRVKSACLLLLLLALPLSAEQDPNVARGIAPSTTFRSFEIDSINEFNGNLMLRLPIGGPLPVGPTLTQNLLLVYNSKLYDFERVTRVDTEFTDTRARPEIFSNAGFGWKLDLGRLVAPIPHLGNRWSYHAPDGAQHDFPVGSAEPDPHDVVTYDGSFLRLRRHPAKPATLEYREISFPDGTRHRFNADGFLTQITDTVGNWIKVSYADPTKWTITNGYGETAFRTTIINFTTYDPPPGYTYLLNPNFAKRISSVEVPAFQSETRHIYQFVYEDKYPLAFLGCSDVIYQDKPAFAAPVLKKIIFPDLSEYVAAYSDSNSTRCTAGVIESLKLPTRGSIAWTQQPYFLPNEQCDDDDGWVSSSAGVKTRILKDASGADVARWTYTTWVNTTNSWIVCEAKNYTMPYGTPPTRVTTTVTQERKVGSAWDAVGGSTVHYFSGRRAWELANRNEYGLPFTRDFPAGTAAPDDARFLSSQRKDAGGTIIQSKYLTYEGDGTFGARLTNPRVSGDLTVYNEDKACPSPHACRVDVAHTDHDGYGRFRQAVTTSNFGPTRTLYTKYLAPTDAWIHGLYDASWAQEVEGTTSTSRKQLFTFDLATGFLQVKRTLIASAADPAAINVDTHRDLLEVLCRDTRGFLTKEKFFGGDGLAANQPIPTTNLCTTAVRATEYQLTHTFDFGTTGAPSRHRTRWAGTNFDSLDEDLDRNTGLVSKSRDVSGVQTEYAYDSLGRVEHIKPAGRPWVLYDYDNATSTARAKLTITTRAAGTTPTAPALTTASVHYDDFGRAVQEQQLMPSGLAEQWSTVNRAYDLFNRTVAVSVPRFRGSDGYDTSFVLTSAPRTSTTYDVLGRPLTVTTADGKESSNVYFGSGVRRIDRSVEIGVTSPSTATTQEIYDAHGRLIDLIEPNAIVTRYDYHVTGGLASVCMNWSSTACGQSRTFVYDNRGFLEQETHPESSTVSYDYDARGQVLAKTIPAAPQSEANLKFVYDGAGRLTDALTYHSATGSYREGKKFEFGTANAGTNRKLGKLVSAKRHNYSAAGTVVVTESYDYDDDEDDDPATPNAGRLSSTTTSITVDGAPLKTLVQSQFYDPSGPVRTTLYPTCYPSSDCGGELRTQNRTFTYGRLTWLGGFADSITYGAGGSVAKVDHVGPVVDTYTPDETGVRVQSILFDNYSHCSAPYIADIGAEDDAVESGQGTYLTVDAPGATHYQWYESDGTPILFANGDLYNTGPLSSTTSYYVRVSNDCSTIQSSLVTVSVCPALSIANGSPADPPSIAPDYTATLTVSATGATGYQWYHENGTPITGQTSATFETPPLSQTTTYYVKALNACGSVESRRVTVTVRPLGTPTGLAATITGSNVSLTWNASSDADHYVIQRKLLGSDFQDWQFVNGTSGVFAAPLNTSCVYAVRAVSLNGSVYSGPSNADLATRMTFTTIIPGQTLITAAVFDELLAAVNAVRAAKAPSSPPLTWPEILPGGVSAPAAGVVILDDHLLPLRMHMNAARSLIGFGPLTYGQPILQGEFIRAVHVTEIRGGVQ